MDAKERLRLYLEQRRELGESELVLDAMPVEELMALIGARPSAKGPARTARPALSAMTPPTPPASGGTSDDADTADEQTPAVNARAAEPPPVPEVRFDASTANTNWRETLRAQQPPDSALKSSGASVPGNKPTGAGSQPPVAPATTPAVAPIAAELPVWLRALEVPAGVAVLRPKTNAEIDAVPGLASATSLNDIAAHIRTCQRCALHASARNPVPGVGNPAAEFVCVGEAPGANEDEQGEPFVGEAGQLLTKILGAIQLTRDSVFICNVLKHRPPANRDPLPDEVQACQPYLRRQLEVIRPRVILALGRFAAQTLLNTTTALGKLRGHVHLYHDTPVIVTYHPAALLRNEAWKRPTWDDVKLARRILDASRASSAS